MQLLILSFKSAFKSYFSVLKPIHNYFGYYFLGGAFLFFWLVSFLFADIVAIGSLFFVQGLMFLAKAFLIFMIPYYAYKEHTGSAPPFWDFIREKLWSLVWNHIKAFLIILLFLFLLIIPGFYKMVRYTFLAESIFFDSPPSHPSRLKSADKTTRGWFWTVSLLLFLSFLIFFSSLLLELIPLPLFLKVPLTTAVSFYVLCYFLLLKVHFYFHLKEKRGESISLLSR